MSNGSTSFEAFSWRSSDYAYTNKDEGNMAGAALAGDNWFLHALPGTIAGAIALVFVIVTYLGLVDYKKKIENKEMLKLGDIIMNGAKDFLRAEYKWLSLFVVFIFTALSLLLINSKNNVGDDVPAFGVYTALPLLLGAALSSGAGWFGMVVATMSNVITVHASNVSINEGLKQAFKSGAIMGFSVTGLGIFGLSIMYYVYRSVVGNESDTWQYLSGFGFGASCIALFARVGGGIYTKAADVGADLVGKVEAGVPEDHPNNAAVIADNVGDNVGDVAGMGADLFESYVGSIIAAATLATQQFKEESGTWDIQRSAIALPFWLSGFGIVCSMIGTCLVRTDAKIEETKEGATDEEKLEAANKVLESLLAAINKGIYFAGFLVVIVSAVLVSILFQDTELAWKIFGCIVIGLLSGIIIGYFTEYSTSYTETPTQGIANKGETGPATVIIQGLGVGMIGTSVPTLVIVIAICACNALMDLYGIAIAAVGMLATLGITLATDAYGPVADNAGGIAEMISDLYPDENDPCYLKPEVRDNTDALDAMGNTTAATGKGFAIGSAVLTAAGLIAAFMDAAGVPATGINIRDPLVLSGVLIGASLPFIFAAITMLSVGRAAEAIILEVRRQFTETPELKTVLHGKIYKNANGEVCEKDAEGAKEFQPDYTKCIAISTDASIMEMLIPGMMAVFMPVAIGFLLTSKGLAGMLVGALSSGFMLAVTMSNAGGAWDNAKKYVEKSGKKGTEHHDATVVGDTVGDPFKDTSGPALNILIKLMSVISLVIAPKLKALQLCPKGGKLAFETKCIPGQILAWEPTGVIIGAVILLLLMLFSYCWQKKIDTDYAEKRDALNKLKEEYAAKEAAKAEEEAKNAKEGETADAGEGETADAGEGETPDSEAAAGDIEMTEQDSDAKKE